MASTDGEGGRVRSGGRRGSGSRRGSGERRRSSFSSTDSWSSYDSEDDDDLPHPRERAHVNSKGFTDFCIKNLANADFGRKEIKYIRICPTFILCKDLI